MAALSVYNAIDIPVKIIVNNACVEMDRALSNEYCVDYEFDYVYVDLDDTLVIDGVVNYKLVGALYSYLNQGKKIILLTKHAGNLDDTLRRYRLSGIFDETYHLAADDDKFNYIKSNRSIFIDDSFAERARVAMCCKIPTFSVDYILLG